MPLQEEAKLTATAASEEAAYFSVPGAYLYTVLHRVADPICRVLLVGPFASERQNSYLPWARWARYLAARRIEVLRFDYRGVGESSGSFDEMTFHDWMDDVQHVAAWFSRRSVAVPLYLHGLEAGACLASQCFLTGMGDGLLLWSPAGSANQALRSTLLRWVGLEQLLTPGAERRTAADYMRRLESDKPVEVEGYQWSPKLWKESFDWKLPPGFETPGDFTERGKPVRVVKLPRGAAPLVRGGFVGYDEVKDFDWLFSEHAGWIEAQGRHDDQVR